MGKWINCKKCGHQYHSSLSKCPECGCSSITFKKILSFVGLAVSLAVVTVGIAFGFLDKGTQKEPVFDQSSSVSFTDESDIESKLQDTSKNEVVKQPTTSENSSDESVSSKEETVSKGESGEQSKPAQNISTNELPIKPTVGTVLKDGKAYVTVPEYYLRAMHKVLSVAGEIDFEEFAYSMTEEEKQNGGLYIVKNADGSATSVLTEAYYVKLFAESLKQSNQVVKQLEEYDFVERTSHSNNFEGVMLVLSVNALSEQEKQLINAAGITFLYSQYFNPKSDNSCVIELAYADKTEERLEFPESLQ